jgi:hypothetical protein
VAPGKPTGGARWVLISPGNFSAGFDTALSLATRLNELRRHDPDLMAHRRQGAGPVMRRPAGLDTDHSTRLRRKERHHLRPPELSAQNRLLGCVHPMQLKILLRRVQANPNNLIHGRLLLLSLNDLSLAQRCREGPSTPSVHLTEKRKS